MEDGVHGLDPAGGPTGTAAGDGAAGTAGGAAGAGRTAVLDPPQVPVHPEVAVDPDWDAFTVLDHLEDWATTRRHLELRAFRAAAHFADLHHPDSRPDSQRRRGRPPGSERGRRLGGTGTPKVLEFAPALLAARTQTAPYLAARLIADALDTRHRLPKLWARVCAGEVEVARVRRIATATRHLTPQAAAWVDEQMTLVADTRISWTRFCDRLDGKVIDADPEAAAAAETRAATDQFVRLGRTNEHGIKTLYARALGLDLIRLDATLTTLTDALAYFGDTDPRDLRRARALGIMANPTLALKLLHAYAAAHRPNSSSGSGSDGPANSSTGPDDQPLPFDDPESNSVGDSLGDTEDGCEGGTEGGTEGDSVGGSEPGPEADPDDCDADQPPEPEPPEPPEDTGPGTQPCPVCGDQPVPDAGAFLAALTTTDLAKLDLAKLTPKATLYLHLTDATVTSGTGVVRWEGETAITAEHLRRFLGPTARFTIKPVLDLANQPPVDAYELPQTLREALHLLHPADTFPYATSRHRKVDGDHVEDYVPPDQGGPPGQTGLHNTQPLVRFHHRLKTHGGWKASKPLPGVILWQSPHGDHYLVDHTGTRRIPRQRPSPEGKTEHPDERSGDHPDQDESA